jgi:hypothetical protein
MHPSVAMVKEVLRYLSISYQFMLLKIFALLRKFLEYYLNKIDIYNSYKII